MNGHSVDVPVVSPTSLDDGPRHISEVLREWVDKNPLLWADEQLPETRQSAPVRRIWPAVAEKGLCLPNATPLAAMCLT